MITKIRKWGNSLGLRVPKSLAEDAKLHEDATVDLRVENGHLTVSVVRPKRLDLSRLLRRVTTKNRPAAVDWGDVRGREAWSCHADGRPIEVIWCGSSSARRRGMSRQGSGPR